MGECLRKIFGRITSIEAKRHYTPRTLEQDRAERDALRSPDSRVAKSRVLTEDDE